ncbi:MAG: hypothetical protein L3J28_12350 [Candidatus Polarisedimenticolaceae bacterium]|nr:hypothetical protein [Candidatus Polarisedimenticolaceae bacterium]
MRKRTRIFLLLSVTIAILDGVFVLMNNAFTTDALHENLHTEGRRLHSSFDTLLAQTYTNMLTMATFISHDKEVQSLFLAGKKAVEIEGGGAGGPRADAVRKRLFDQVGPNWKEVQKDLQVRQLHFHLGPGSTSFLRVHRPDKFGDNMDNVRFTIVDTNAEQQPRVGFETGRVYSGLRGVVPVSTWDPDVDKMVHVGALEVGTSFSVMLDILDQRNDVGAGIFLTMDHVTKAMWPDFVKQRFGVALDGCDCVLEASTRDGIDNILNKMFEEGIRIQNHGTEIIHLDDTSSVRLETCSNLKEKYL